MEIGCGDGLVSSIFFRGKKNAVDVGIDLDIDELRRAEKTGIYKKLRRIDITKNAFETNTFNTIFANGVLEHIPDLELAIKQISRILKPGGELITTSPTANYTRLLFYYRVLSNLNLYGLAQKYGNFINKTFAHRHLLTHEEWQLLLKRHHLIIKKYYFYNNSFITAIHDISLPLALGTKLTKRRTDRMVLFPDWRARIIKKFSPIITQVLNSNANNTYEKNASILIIAQKK